MHRGRLHDGPPSLLDHEGPSLLAVLAVPVTLVLAAVLIRRRDVRRVVAAALTFLCLLGAASIGLFLLPVAGLAWALAYSTSARSAAK